jgi:hypothetical protein
MYNIIDEKTGLLLFCKSDNEVLEGQIAIKEICTIESQGDIFYNFETHEFYLKQ